MWAVSHSIWHEKCSRSHSPMPTQSLGQLPTTHNPPHKHSSWVPKKKRQSISPVRVFGCFQASVLLAFGLGLFTIYPNLSFKIIYSNSTQACMQIHWLRMFTRLRHWAGLILLEVVKSTKACSGLAVAVMTCVGLDPRSFAAEFQFSCSISPLNAEQQGISDWETLFFAHNCLMNWTA